MSTHPATVPARCLKCEADLSSPILCTGCRTLYPIPASMDHFDLLGLERRHDISDHKLMAAYRAMARQIHPDRFTEEPAEAGTLATRLSAQLNQAVEVLRDPLQRANYMLELAGGPGASEVRDVPGTLLVEVMTLREEIDDARDNNDGATLDRLRSSIAARREETLSEIARRADQLASCSHDDKRTLRELINSAKYFDNLLGQLATDPLAASSGANDA